MTDKWTFNGDRVDAPARSARAITPNDTTELAVIPKAIFVGTAGNITLRAIDDQVDVVLKNVSAGTVLPVRAQFVRAAGTTAADLVGLA